MWENAKHLFPGWKKSQMNLEIKWKNVKNIAILNIILVNLRSSGCPFNLNLLTLKMPKCEFLSCINVRINILSNFVDC